MIVHIVFSHACLGDRYLLQNMDWLEEELGGFEDDYLIFDCPGMLGLFFEVRTSH